MKVVLVDCLIYRGLRCSQRRHAAPSDRDQSATIRIKRLNVFDYLKEHMELVSSFPRSVAGLVLHYVRILLAYQITVSQVS